MYLFVYLFIYAPGSILTKTSLIFAFHFYLYWDLSLGKQTKNDPRRPSQQGDFKTTSTQTD